jgi:hypothetical protein
MLTKYDVYIALLYFVWKTWILYLHQDTSVGNQTTEPDWCDDLLEEVETPATRTTLVCYMST